MFQFSGVTYEVISTTLPPAILWVDCEKCGIGVEVKVRNGVCTGRRFGIDERSTEGVALQIESLDRRRGDGLNF